MDLLEFIIDDLPLGVDNALEIVNVAYSDLSIFLL